MIGKNKPKCFIRTKEQLHRYYRNSRMRIKLEVISHYGIDNKPVCINCGFDDIRALTIDHIFNDGNEQKRLLPETGGSRFYPWLRKHHYPVGYQTLCMNCQFIKRDEVFRFKEEKA